MRVPRIWWRTACLVGVVLLPGLLLTSFGDKDAELNDGLTAARAGDYNGALEIWLPLAQRGSSEAQFRLGWLYETGLGTGKDPIMAARWYSQAAAQGHSRALYSLGLFSYHGWGTPQDDTKAANYLFEAAEKGYAKAQYTVGILYKIGRGVPKDLSKARYWFNRAKTNGYVHPNDSNQV